MTYKLNKYIVDELYAERQRQNAKFPDQHRRLAAGSVDDRLMLAILVEEVGEVGKAMLEYEDDDQVNEVRKELVQVAAVCIAWIEGIDERQFAESEYE